MADETQGAEGEAEPPKGKTQLSPEQLFRLDLACKPLAEVFDFPPYLVGSVNNGPGFRDVDVRVLIKDKPYDHLVKAFGGRDALTFLGFAVAAYLREMTGLPIDFQFQRQSDANELFPTKPGQVRNSLGTRDLSAWTGDATPDTWRPRVIPPSSPDPSEQPAQGDGGEGA